MVFTHWKFLFIWSWHLFFKIILGFDCCPVYFSYKGLRLYSKEIFLKSLEDWLFLGLVLTSIVYPLGKRQVNKNYFKNSLLLFLQNCKKLKDSCHLTVSLQFYIPLLYLERSGLTIVMVRRTFEKLNWASVCLKLMLPFTWLALQGSASIFSWYLAQWGAGYCYSCTSKYCSNTKIFLIILCPLTPSRHGSL